MQNTAYDVGGSLDLPEGLKLPDQEPLLGSHRYVQEEGTQPVICLGVA